MIIAKTKAYESDMIVVVVEYIFDEESQNLMVLQHNFLKLKDETLLDQDYMVHQVDPKAFLQNANGWAFLDTMGEENKKGRLSNIAQVEEYPTGGIECPKK